MLVPCCMQCAMYVSAVLLCGDVEYRGGKCVFILIYVYFDQLKLCAVNGRGEVYVCECCVVLDGNDESPSNHTYTVDAKSHPSPLFPLCNTHTHHTPHIISSTAPTTHHIVTLGFADRPRRSDFTDGQRSWLVYHKLEIRIPPPH